MSFVQTFAQRFRALEASILQPNPLGRAMWCSDRQAIERALHGWEMAQRLDLTMDEHWDRYVSVREALYDEAADAYTQGRRLYPVANGPDLEGVAREQPHGTDIPDPQGDDELVHVAGSRMTYAEYQVASASAARIETKD